jgi:hypothetical protein
MSFLIPRILERYPYILLDEDGDIAHPASGAIQFLEDSKDAPCVYISLEHIREKRDQMIRDAEF